MKIDDSTGLPELPEGLWWRIGEVKPFYGTGGWVSSRNGLTPAIQIMEMQTVEKTREVPIYGKHWWSKNMIVNHGLEVYYEDDPVAVFTNLFGGYSASKREDIPEHAVECGSSGPSNGEPTEWLYEYVLDSEGTKALAVRTYHEYMDRVIANQKWKMAEKAKREASEKLFGDYPPKNLNRSTD